MFKKNSDGDWKGSILSSLRKRNYQEKGIIVELVNAHNHLYDTNEKLKQENSHLSLTNERLKVENIHLQQNVISTPSPIAGIGASDSALCQQFEKKIFKQQEELTELHRRKSESAQQLVEINQCLQERDKQLNKLQNKLDEKESELLISEETIAEKDKKIQDLEYENQFLRDEYQALNLMHNSLEQKFEKNEKEMQDLVQRWVKLKAKDAERLNEENEAVLRKRQEALEERLKEATLDDRFVIEEDKFACVSPVCISASLPSKAYLQFDAHEGDVNALAFSPQGRIIATGGSDRRVRLWDISHGTADSRGTLTGSNAAVIAIDFDSEESKLLAASSDMACRIWTLADCRLRHTLTGHSGKVMACKFLTDRTRAVTGSHDRTLKIWDMRSISCIKTLFPASSCNDIAVSDSHITTVVSAHFDKTVKFWDMRVDKNTSSVNLMGKVTSLCVSQDNFYLLCCVRDDALKIIDLRKNEILRTMSHEGFVVGADYTRAVFSPDTSYAACGSSSGSIFIWNANSGALAKELAGHSSCVVSCVWHPNGRTLVSCDRSKKVISWGDF